MSKVVDRESELVNNEKFVNESLGAQIIAASKGYAKCSMKLETKHANSLGTPMGGVIFTLADYAFAVASNQNGKTVVTQASQITFLTPAVGTELFATANALREGGQTSFYYIIIEDELGTQVAFATINGYLIEQET